MNLEEYFSKHSWLYLLSDSKERERELKILTEKIFPIFALNIPVNTG